MTVPLRVAIVPGVTPARWVTAWRERRTDRAIEVVPIDEADARGSLDRGEAHLVFARLPLGESVTGAEPIPDDGLSADDGLSVIRLYEELPVVVVSVDHPVSVFDTVTTADLAGEAVRAEAPADAVEIVAAGAGVALMPKSVARQFSRKDVAAVEVTDAPSTTIALVWPTAATDDDIDEFIGIVRGRTARSSRGSAPEAPAVKKQARAGGETRRQAPARGSRGRTPSARRRGRR